MTPQSLDAVVALVPVEPTPGMLRAGFLSESEGFGFDTPSDAPGLVYRAMLAAAPDWHPTPEAINALPQPLRDYIHTIQTSHPSYDNAVKVKLLEEKVAALRDRWRTEANFDGYETGVPHIDEATANREAATLKCADELDALTKGDRE